MKVSANSLKQGNVIVHEGRLWVIAKPTDHVKPGKGPAYVQAEMKELKTGTKLNHRFSSSDYIEKAYLERKPYQFLYEMENILYMMSQDDAAQIEVNKNAINKDQLPFIHEGMVLEIEFFEEDAINFILPTTVILEIESTEPSIKGSTAAPSYKPALMSNGVTVKVPSYLSSGEKIVVKVEDCSFVERAK